MPELSRERKGETNMKVIELEPVEVEEKPRTLETTVNVNYSPLKRKCSFPYFRSCQPFCRHYRYNFTSKWHLQILNKLEREKEKLVCISSPIRDSYEALCSIPLCTIKPQVSIKLTEPFNSIHCVFCDKSLYMGGTIHDLHELVPAIKRQSNDKGDDLAYRIGIRTRIVVHKSCFDEYIKRNVTNQLDSNSNGSNSNDPQGESDELCV